jgi:hypothetical protein
MSELEASLSVADGIKTDSKGDRVEWIVELNKATGLAAGVLTEAAMLMGDMQHLIQGGPLAQNKQDFIEKILGGLKGPGNAN